MTAEARHYTVDEANEALETVAPLVERLQAAHAAMDERHDRVMESIPTNGGGAVHKAFLDASLASTRALETLNGMGIVVRDPAAGLIDFPSIRDGREVFLCWRLGEDKVAWWHPVETGFAGREPL